MKFLLLINILLLSLLAKNYTYSINAKVIAKHASIYSQANENSMRKNNYFKQGNNVKVAYCNKYRWCKIRNGYIKQDLLNIKSYRFTTSAKINKTTYTPLPSTKVYTDKKHVKKTLKRLPIYPKKYRKYLDPYDKYFSNQSSEVKMNNSKI